MRVSNEHSDEGNGIRPLPGDGEAKPDQGIFRLSRVDWILAEAQVEAEFSIQRDRLLHRLHDRDYPYPQVIDQLAALVAEEFG